jgi:hypothetical protein
MHGSLRFAIAVTVVSFTLAVVGAEAQDASSRRSAQGPVTVVITLLAPPAPGVPIRAKIVLDTHSVGLDGIAFDQAVALRMPDGREVAPQIEQVKGGGHHREATLVFPASSEPAPCGSSSRT